MHTHTSIHSRVYTYEYTHLPITYTLINRADRNFINDEKYLLLLTNNSYKDNLQLLILITNYYPP